MGVHTRMPVCLSWVQRPGKKHKFPAYCEWNDDERHRRRRPRRPRSRCVVYAANASHLVWLARAQTTCASLQCNALNQPARLALASCNIETYRSRPIEAGATGINVHSHRTLALLMRTVHSYA